uniref:TNFR-Cys domain-containing protein n=1 Tax=Magallana gigas TaxID=29159 RepID=A0A8W8LI31_MAGGI
MDLTSSLVLLPLCILLKAEIMKTTNIQVPECRLDGRLQRSGNTSEDMCTQCRECLNKSLCKKSVKTKCIQCPPGSFVRLTRKEKICRGCRKCLKSVHHIRCADIVDLNCKLDCRHTTTDHRCKACPVCREDEFTKANFSATHNTVSVLLVQIVTGVASGTYKSVHNRSMSRCVPCEAGRFMDKDQHFLTFCKTCRRCGPHELIVQACNITHDTRCGPCISGYFACRHPTIVQCVRPVPPNSTGLEVDECRQSTNASRICMPLTPLYDHHYQRPSPKDPPLKSASTPPFQPPTSDFRIGSKLDEKPLELDFETELNTETEHSQLPDKSTHDSVVILVVALISNPKYNSDPDFHKADFRNVSEYAYPARNARVPKSRSMGTVDVMDLEFWRNW